jgi:transcriptional regulator with XRE-family HTH domain
MDETEFLAHLGHQIAVRRKAMGLTQAALSEAIGLSRPSVSNVEAGAQGVSAFQLVALSKVFGTTIGELVGEQNTWAQERWMELARRNQASKLTYEGLAAQIWASNALNVQEALKFRYLAEGIGIAQNHQISVSKEPS